MQEPTKKDIEKVEKELFKDDIPNTEKEFLIPLDHIGNRNNSVEYYKGGRTIHLALSSVFNGF